jgi:hypothetical protein
MPWFMPQRQWGDEFPADSMSVRSKRHFELANIPDWDILFWAVAMAGGVAMVGGLRICRKKKFVELPTSFKIWGEAVVSS